MVSQPSCASPPVRLAFRLSRTRFGLAVSKPWVPPRKRSSIPSTLASRGWANYHRHVICSETFARLDRFVWRRLYRWAKRRHPDKTGRWNTERYFPHQPGEAWRFTDPLTGKQGIRVQEVVKPQRYLKVKGEANPFDPVWEGYFHHRDGNHQNNQLGNLVLLHPNCHRQEHYTPEHTTESSRPSRGVGHA